MSSWDFNTEPLKVPEVKTKYRRIVTPLPVPKSLEMFEKLSRFEARSMHGQMPVVWDRAEGFQVFDPYGNCWIDFTSTIFVTNAGHANPQVCAALSEQIEKKMLHSYTYANRPRVDFLEYLIKVTPEYIEKAFLLSAGTEATECALKLMRMHGQRMKPSKVGIISFTGCMHGRTMAVEILRGTPESSSWIGYRDPNVFHLPVPFVWTRRSASGEYDWGKHCEEDLKKLQDEGMAPDNIAGIIIEPYLGWAGSLLPSGYVKALAAFAKKHNILFTFDEIQAGFGRTGKMFTFEHYDVQPDLVCVGKGLSGSLPLSGVIGRREILDLPDVGSMSSTHSANPLSCAAGLANLKAIVEGGLITESARKGEILHKRLKALQKKHPDRISYVFGKGLLAGIIFKDPQTGQSDSEFPSLVCERSMQKGLLLVHTGRESIKMGPPLMISDEALLEGLDVFEESLEEVLAGAREKGLI